ncbi:hypothetical protein J5N97_017583 [Dioscorea zingiberensis]|uniref:Pentatricopeptide repeat-containing protein n=1 Tax=Dioscorea zingiberensis TaxID=325984 RepID=A0A9D5HGQ1_9LILI|nr:hypothetical protein J5N97_017583 [Dioscorea zingiberensis]
MENSKKQIQSTCAFQFLPRTCKNNSQRIQILDWRYPSSFVALLPRLVALIESHMNMFFSLCSFGAGRINHYATRSSDIHHRHSGYGGLLQSQVKNQLDLGANVIRATLICGDWTPVWIFGNIPSKYNSHSLQDSGVDHHSKSDAGPLPKQRIGQNVSSVDKRKFLLNTLFDLKDSKEAVYGTLDAWVAWEQEFPLPMLKRALLVLEKMEQWHKVVQVLKWMLSKGQGTTRGTYEQLIRALEKDGRPEEAHNIWVKKVSHDLHSVPWRVCDLMISIYYRNNMLERLVKLFKGLEEFDRKPPCKSIVRKVADAFEMLGLLEEKSRVLEKYSHLFNEASDGHFKKSRKASRKNDKQYTKKKEAKSVGPSDKQPLDSGSSDAEIDVVV